MPDYEMLRVIWWLLLGALLIGFAVMDGFDLGVGATFRFLGRNDEERRVLLECIEPVWEGNQVWFVLGGGAVFAAFPLLYAASFSSLYLAMFLILLAFIVRPVGFNFRGKIADPRWRAAWDTALTVSGVVPGLLCGVAFGNLFLGLPYHFDALLRPTYTGSFLGLLHPFALLAGVVSLAMLILHGCTYAALKAGEPMAGRAARLARTAALVYALAFIAAGIWLSAGVAGQHITGGADPLAPSDPTLKQVSVATGAWLDNYARHASFWLAPLGALVSACLAVLLLALRRPGIAFIASALAVTGTVLTAGLALFPFLMPSSSDPAQGLTIWDASSSEKTLLIMLAATAVFLPLIILY